MHKQSSAPNNSLALSSRPSVLGWLMGRRSRSASPRRRSFPSVPQTPFGDEATEILPWLFLGTVSAAANLSLLRSHRITGLINCTCSRPMHAAECATLNLAVDDKPTVCISDHFDEAIRWARANRGGILVYCGKGVSRSCTVALAILMSSQAVSLFAAWSHVKARRPIVRPNAGFMQQLQAYERRLRGGSSVQIVGHEFRRMATTAEDNPPGSVPRPVIALPGRR